MMPEIIYQTRKQLKYNQQASLVEHAVTWQMVIYWQMVLLSVMTKVTH